MTEGIESNWIPGFWRRIGAFLIDSIILGLFGIGLGLFLEAQFVQLGGWGRFVGFFIALFYFGLLNSHIAGGQTVGKKLVDIRVVDGNNQPINVIRSFVRYSILGIPFFLNGAQFTNDAIKSIWIYPISFVIFGGMLAVTYLYIFNRATRQSLHDLAVGTFVVITESDKTSAKPIWRPHLAVVAALFLVSALLPLYTSSLAQNRMFTGLFSAQAALAQHPSVTYVGVSAGTTSRVSSSDETSTTTYLSATAILKDDTVSNTELAGQLATILAGSHPDSQQVDVIQIVLSYGFDIGIASSWTNHSYTFSPADLADEY